MPAREVPGNARAARLLACFAVAAAMYGYGFRLVRVEGISMEPTFHDRQFLIVRRLNWPAPPLRTGDVIVFQESGRTLVKRIAALAGQPFPPEALRNPKQDTVPEGRLFVLGDNREHSEDSRDFGPVPVETVIGRVLHWSRAGSPAAVSETGSRTTQRPTP